MCAITPYSFPTTCITDVTVHLMIRGKLRFQTLTNYHHFGLQDKENVAKDTIFCISILHVFLGHNVVHRLGKHSAAIYSTTYSQTQKYTVEILQI